MHFEKFSKEFLIHSLKTKGLRIKNYYVIVKAVNERDEALDTVRKSESVFINYLLASFSQKKL